MDTNDWTRPDPEAVDDTAEAPGADDVAAQADDAGAGLEAEPAADAPGPIDDEDEVPGPPEHVADDGDIDPPDDGTDEVAEGIHEPDADEEPVTE